MKKKQKVAFLNIMFEESNKIVKAEGDFLRKLRDNRKNTFQQFFSEPYKLTDQLSSN